MGSILDDLFQEEARIEEIIHLSSATMFDYDIPDSLRDFIDSFPISENHPLFDDLPYLKEFVGAEDIYDDGFREDVIDALQQNQIGGLLVKSACCVRRPAGGGFTYSGWGICHITWLHASDIAEAERKTLEWAKDCHEKDKKLEPVKIKKIKGLKTLDYR